MESGPDDGRLGFILLDVRVHPPQPVDGTEVWSDGSGRGAYWNGSYGVLAEHYPWLARTASREQDGAFHHDTMALGVPVARPGSATLAYWPRKRDLPSDRPHRDFVLAMVHEDPNGEVQWAKRVPLTPRT